MQTTNRPSILEFCYNLRREYENIQIKSKLLAKVDVFFIIFRKNEHSDLLILLACWIQHSISCYIRKYFKKTTENVFKDKNVWLNILTRERWSTIAAVSVGLCLIWYTFGPIFAWIREAGVYRGLTKTTCVTPSTLTGVSINAIIASCWNKYKCIRSD